MYKAGSQAEAALIVDLARASSLAYEAPDYVEGAWAAAHAAKKNSDLASPYNDSHIDFLSRVVAAPAYHEAKVCDANMYSMVYKSTNESASLILAFRGTDSVVDALCDINLAKARFRGTDIPSNVRVHAGFNDQWKALQPQCNAVVEAFVADHPGLDIICTGHSMGSSVGSLAALYYASSAKTLDVASQPAVRFTGLGCPRVGNQAFVDLFQNRVQLRVRIANGEDPVCKLPPAQLEYSHFDYELHIGGPDEHPCVADFLDLADHDYNAYVKGMNAWYEAAYPAPDPPTPPTPPTDAESTGESTSTVVVPEPHGNVLQDIFKYIQNALRKLFGLSS